MTAVRKHLQLFCCLTVALWMILIAAGIAQGCQLSSQDSLASHASMEMGAKSGLISGAGSNSAHLEASWTTCFSHCEDSAVGVIKSTQKDFGQLAVLALTFYLLVRFTTLLLPALKLPSRRLSFAIVRDPPATIRYHRFNI